MSAVRRQTQDLSQSMIGLDESFMDGEDAFKENLPGDDDLNRSRRYSFIPRFSTKRDSRRHSVAGKASVKQFVSSSLSTSKSRKHRTTSRKRLNKEQQHLVRDEHVRAFFGTPPKCKKPKEWLSQASPTVVGRMDKNEKRRQEAGFEVTNGEAKYVRNLEHIDKVFAKIMLKMGYITKAEHAAIFGNLTEILAKHQELSTALSEARGREGIYNIGEIYLNWWKSWNPDQAYGQYCANLAYGKHVLRSVKEKFRGNKNDGLDEYLARATELKGSGRQDLRDMLDTPRRRIQNYNLLLKALRKFTPSSDPDAGRLEEVLKLVASTCKEVDKSVRDKGRDRIVAIQESIDFSHSLQRINLVDDNVPLLLEGEAFLKDYKPCKLFLFQHMFLITKESKHDTSKLVIVNRPIQITHLEIQSGNLTASFKGKVRDEDNDTHLTVRNCDPSQFKTLSRRGQPRSISRATNINGKAMTIKFSNKDERDEWVHAIETLKQEYTAESVITFV